MLTILEDTKKNQTYVAKERKDEDLVDLDPKRHQKEKKTQELNQALKVMGIRPSTFNAWVIADRPDKVKELLEEALVLRTEDIQNRPVLGNKLAMSSDKQQQKKGGTTATKPGDKAAGGKKSGPNSTNRKKSQEPHNEAIMGEMAKPDNATMSDAQRAAEKYNPYIDLTADLPTMHEAFQYLMKTYVDDVHKARELKKKVGNATAATSVISAFQMAGAKNPSIEIDEPPAKTQQEIDEEKIKAIQDELDKMNLKNNSKKKGKSGGGGGSGERTRLSSTDTAPPISGRSSRRHSNVGTEPRPIGELYSPSSDAKDPLAKSGYLSRTKSLKANHLSPNSLSVNHAASEQRRRKSVTTIAISTHALTSRRGSQY